MLFLEVLYSLPVLFLFGACWGSFLNVVFYRFPLGRSVVFPNSACPNCATPIAFYDNIPVLSWLFLRGKCRHCHHPIAFRYVLVECLGGLAFVVGGSLHPGTPIAGLALGFLFLGAGGATYLLVICRRAPVYLFIVAVLGLGTYAGWWIWGV